MGHGNGNRDSTPPGRSDGLGKLWRHAHQVKISFDTLEDAISHATAQGWEYTVSIPQERKLQPRNYGDKFRYIPTEKRS